MFLKHTYKNGIPFLYNTKKIEHNFPDRILSNLKGAIFGLALTRKVSI